MKKRRWLPEKRPVWPYDIIFWTLIFVIFGLVDQLQLCGKFKKCWAKS